MTTIGTKLGLGIAIPVILCIVIGLFSYSQTNMVREKLEEVTRVKEPTNSAVSGMGGNLAEAAFAALGYFSTGDRRFRQAFEKGRDNFLEKQTAFETAVRAGGGERLDPDIQEKFTRFYTLAADQFALKDRQTRQMEDLQKDFIQIDELLTDRIQAAIKSDDPVAYRRLQAALGMQVAINGLLRALGNYLLTGDPGAIVALTSARRKFEHFFDVYRVVLLSPDEKAWAAELRQRADQTLPLALRMIELQKEREAQQLAFMESYRDLGSLINDQLQTRTELGLAAAKTDLIEAGQIANTRILVLLLFSVAFAAGAGLVTTRSITGPLRALVSVMNAVAKGEQPQQVELRSSDEFRILGDAFNEMTGRLAEAERQRLAGLRAFASSVQQAQEEERARISRELHDDLCQRLSGMKFRVEAMEESVRPLNRRVSRELGEMTEELDRSISEVRRISSNLRPSALDDFGLTIALRLLCRDFEQHHHIPATLYVDSALPSPLEGNVEIAVYRIAQEALSNVARHANAASVGLHLAADGGRLILQIEDDGRGFSAEDVLRAREGGHGAGFLSMRERAEILGGSCDIRSEPDQGTTVTVHIPLDSHGKDQSTHR